MSNKMRKKKTKSSDPIATVTAKPALSLYAKNLVFLKAFAPQLATRVESLPSTRKYQVQKTGPKNLWNLTLPDRNGFFYDLNDPIEQTREELKKLDLKNAKCVLFLGCGLGYEIDCFLQDHSQKAPTTHMVIVEKELEVFAASMQVQDYAAMGKLLSLHLVVGEPQEELFGKMQDQFSAGYKLVVLLKAMKPVFLMQTLQRNKEYYLQALKAFREAGIYRLNNFGNSIEDSLIGVQNMLENINEIIYNPGINLLFDQFKGKPAIVASTGPSLNKTKHLLKGLEEKALIIAPEASLRPLMAIGVKPHMIVSIERTPEVVPLMEGFQKEEVCDVYYSATPVILNKAYQAYPGPRIIVYRNFDHFKWLQIDRGILNISHSTGNMSFEIAAAMGCDPIILIGQDLAYGREGITHASGVFHDDKQKFKQENRIQVPGNDGEPVYTNQLWQLFRTSYELALSKYPGTCINCSEGGAYIKGSTFMRFEEAIPKYITKPYFPLEKIKSHLSHFSSKQAEEDRKRVFQLVLGAIDVMEGMYQSCAEAVQALKDYDSELLALLNQKDYCKENEERLKYIHSHINGFKLQVQKNKETFQLLFMHIIQSFYLNFEIEMNAIPNKHDVSIKASIETILSQKKWFAVIGDTAKLCIGLLEKAKEDIVHPYNSSGVREESFNNPSNPPKN